VRRQISLARGVFRLRELFVRLEIFLISPCGRDFSLENLLARP
jgi:hypothetical protein